MSWSTPQGWAAAGASAVSDVITGGTITNGVQFLAAGTTSSSAITFATPTGGSGSYSYSSVLAHTDGTGASISGSDPGPYTITGLEDGDSVTLTRTADDGAGQVLKETAFVAVKTAAGGGVTNVLATIDFSAMAVQSLADGSHTIDGHTFITDDDTNGPIEIVAAGLRLYAASGAGGYARLYIDLDQYGYDPEQPVFICFLIDITAIADGGLFALLSKQAQIANTNDDIRCDFYDNAGSAELYSRHYTTSWASNMEAFNGGTMPAQARLGIDSWYNQSVGYADAGTAAPSLTSRPTTEVDITTIGQGIRTATTAGIDRSWIEAFSNAAAAAGDTDITIRAAYIFQPGANA